MRVSLFLLELGFCFLPPIQVIFSYSLFKEVFCLLPPLFCFWNPYNANVTTLDGVTEFSKSVFIFLIIFFLTSVELDGFPSFCLSDDRSFLLLALVYCVFHLVVF